MKKLLITLFLLVNISLLSANEGMWLPSLIKDRIPEMKKMGFKLSSEDIYSINKASMKDAIVHFGGGCTGELISEKGLLITNHHCGFSYIQSHSTVEHDYLKDGFWAMNMEEELPNDNLTVSFLVKMEDVTDAVLKSYLPSMSESERQKIVAENSARIIENATKGTTYKGSIESLYYGNQYFLFIYETFNDVRLVCAPPSSIGKFGGDTDNWMWPRHTGDFSIFRIYADKNNRPAKYSKNNVPYRPKKYFSISTTGINEGDFTLVYGFPGKTQEYLMSSAVKYISEVSNPHKIKLRTLRLDVQKEYMSQNQEIRIMYAAKNANVANSWKKWQGEMNGIKRMNIVEKKTEYEKRFNEWAKNRDEYKNIVSSLDSLYKMLEPYSFANDYNNEAINSNEILKFTGSLLTCFKGKDGNIKNEDKDSVKNIIELFFKDYHLPIDKKCFVLLIDEYRKNIPLKFQPEYFISKMREYEGDIYKFADYVFDNSIFANQSQCMKILQDSVTISTILKDPAVEMYFAFKRKFDDDIKPEYNRLNNQITLLYRKYMKGQMEFDKKKDFYPDANSTLRVAYGKVSGYRPADGIYYKPYSTLEGIIEKDNPQIYDYNIPQTLRDIHKNKDYGKWNINGTVPVCFIANNHTSGGNSGSPVINGKGELIGINFDRVWEGTMSDIAFDPDMCRNICLDIRYVLFLIDKYANAQWILKEISINN